MTKKHRLMVNMDKDLYEYLRNLSHVSRRSISKILNETVQKLKDKDKAKTGAA